MLTAGSPKKLGTLKVYFAITSQASLSVIVPRGSWDNSPTLRCRRFGLWVRREKSRESPYSVAANGRRLRLTAPFSLV